MTNWTPIDKTPVADVDLLLVSKEGQYFTGQYKGDNQYQIYTKWELQNNGSLMGFTTRIHKVFFSHWAIITSPK